MYKLLGLCLTFSTLLALATMLSLCSTLFWRVFGRLFNGLSASARANLLFWLRFVPITASAALVLFFLVPSYVLNEPKDSGEVVTAKFAIASLISIAGLIMAAWRGFESWKLTVGLQKGWMRDATRVTVESVSIPTYCIEHAFPVVAVVGSIKPKLFIARKVIESLSREELAAALAHEGGHMMARDNLKRRLLRACRDVLTVIPCGRLLDREWSEAAEAAADEHAAQEGKTIALDLAASLVKIARMVPPGVTPISAVGSLLIGDNMSAIAWRVRRLTELASLNTAKKHHRNSFLQIAVVSIVSGAVLTLLIPHYREILFSVHNLTESIVSLLQ